MPESAFYVKLAKNDYLAKPVNQASIYIMCVSCARAQCVSMNDCGCMESHIR